MSQITSNWGWFVETQVWLCLLLNSQKPYLSRCTNLDKLSVYPFGSNGHFCHSGYFLVLFAGQPEKKVLVTVLCPQEVLKHQLASCAKTTKALWNTDSFISNPEEVKTWIFKDLCVQLLQFYNFTGWIFFSSSVLHHKTQSVASRAQVADICDANNCIYKTVYLVTP